MVNGKYTFIERIKIRIEDWKDDHGYNNAKYRKILRDTIQMLNVGEETYSCAALFKAGANEYIAQVFFSKTGALEDIGGFIDIPREIWITMTPYERKKVRITKLLKLMEHFEK